MKIWNKKRPKTSYIPLPQSEDEEFNLNGDSGKFIGFLRNRFKELTLLSTYLEYFMKLIYLSAKEPFAFILPSKRLQGAACESA